MEFPLFPRITSQPCELSQTVPHLPCHHTLYTQAPYTQSPHFYPPAATHVCFHFFPPSFLLKSPPHYRYRGLPLSGNLRGGVVPLLFTALVHLFFSFFFSIADCPFSPTCTRPPCPSSRIAFAMSPLPCVVLATSHLMCHAVDVPPSLCPLSCRPLRAHRLSPCVTYPSHVMSRLRLASPLSSPPFASSCCVLDLWGK